MFPDLKIYCTILFIILSLFGCTNKEEYNVLKYYTPMEADTLLTNIITYVSKKPKTANWETKHQEKYRSYYVKQLPDFNIKYYHISENDSLHYFYIIRPARSTLGNKRGVGGKFSLDSNLRISQFEEIFNTPVASPDSLEIIGEKLFVEMVNKGKVDNYLKDRSLVEWPDERLKYDKTINEWVYTQ